ncbi:hypothetical protein AB205_0101710, partial [Aquarana catesbeiana]
GQDWDTHMDPHVKKVFRFKDKIIRRCRQPCRRVGHYHCHFCKRTIIRRMDMERHLPLCSIAALLIPPPAASSPVPIPPPAESSPLPIPPPAESSPVPIPPPAGSSPVPIPPPAESSPVPIPPPAESSPVLIPPPAASSPVPIPPPAAPSSVSNPQSSTSVVEHTYALPPAPDTAKVLAEF